MEVETIRKEGLSFNEATQRFEIGNDHIIKRWERIYLEEGPEGSYIERQGRACAASGTQKGRKPKLSKQTEEDLIAENQRLHAENDYLKNLQALVLESERNQRKKRNAGDTKTKAKSFISNPTIYRSIATCYILLLCKTADVVR